MTTNAIAKMSDQELLHKTAEVVADECRLTAGLLALLGELDARRLYLGQGCSSLFVYCTNVLHFSEQEAYHRIATARAARYFPLILDWVADGSITTTTVVLLRSHLTVENHARLLAEARFKNRREVEHQVACLAPKSEIASLVRRLPEARPGSAAHRSHGMDNLADRPLLAGPLAESKRVSDPGSTAEGPDSPASDPDDAAAAPGSPAAGPASWRSKVEPLARDRYLLRVTLSAEAHANLRRAQDLLGHSVPDRDPAAVIDRALSLLVTHLERQKAATSSRPRRAPAKHALAAGSRHLPAAVRREVWARDGGRCAFVGPRGRCGETARLEFHHLVPFARGGHATAGNISLRCRAHNGYESELCFGRWKPAARRPRS